MTAYVRKNALDQALDIAGSLLQSDTRTLSNEPDGYGAPISGQTGSLASITTLTANGANVTGLTGMTAQSKGRFLTLSGTASASNTGTFLIDGYVNDGYVTIVNASAVANDVNNAAIVWTERTPYTLEDDINFARTDRRLIKGTAAFHSAVPVYTRPTNTSATNIPANLTNIAGKTLDAHAWVVNRVYRADPVVSGDGYSTLTAASAFQYADSVDRTGVPIVDGFDAANLEAHYVEIINPVTENYLIDGYTGHRIFGRTRQGTTGVEPNTIEVEFRKVALGADISGSTAYTWDGYQPTTVDYYYGYRERADNLTETAFRTTLVNGLFADSQSATNINNILTTIGTTIGDTYLTLTNTGNYYVFSDLPDGTPSITEVFNTINTQIGDRIFTGSVIGNDDGYTITKILQDLADAIAAANFVRVIERLPADINANVAHTIPGGYSYTLDGSNNGQNLVIYTRGVLRDPGPIVDGNDYAETSTTSVTFYTKQKLQDHINYFVYA